MQITTENLNVTNQVAPTERKQVRDALGRSYGTGRRKNAIARVWIKPGKGVIQVNKKTIDQYFDRAVLKMRVRSPFEVTKNIGNFDVFCTVKGGGHSGQADAICLGISRALVKFDPAANYTFLRKSKYLIGSFLTRDSRVVERKKYGQSGARKRYQFSKR